LFALNTGIGAEVGAPEDRATARERINCSDPAHGMIAPAFELITSLH